MQCTCAAAAPNLVLPDKRPLTLLFDLPNLPHRLFEDGTFVWFDVKAVDVTEVGRYQLGQLFDIFALLLSPPSLTPAESDQEK